ncbi:MAG: ArsR family transcriptional regulator [Anaerolineae bacterium]|nr:MAG: ArsR family transcriptional regulator [Anaerolineae bacterium]
MHENIEAVQESTVAGLGRLAGFFGFSEVMGRLYGTLLLSPEALSLDDLAEDLQISKGSVSMNMRSLERWGMAKEVWMRGERKKYYMAESQLWTVIRNVLSGRELREVQLALEVLEESVDKLRAVEDELPADESDLAKYTLRRIADLRSFFQLAQMALETFVDSRDEFDEDEINRLLAR